MNQTVKMEVNEGGDYFLELDPSPITFEPVSKITNVFFDEVNRQVFVVRSGGATGVVVKNEKTTIDFRMEDKGDVISMKFSPDQKILAIQRCQKSVEFVNFSDGAIDPIEYSQCCKGRSTQILGFVWPSINEVVFVTDHGVELYQVFPDRRNFKSLKTHKVTTNWFVYHPESSLLVVSSGPLGNILHSFQFRPGTMYSLPKFEVDLPVIPKPVKLSLFERDVVLGSIYRKERIIVLRHQVRSGTSSAGAELVLYTLQKEGPPRKTNTLRLDLSGRFAINIVEDLILVHHQHSKTSLIFDIKLPGETDGFVTYHKPLISPHPIKPFKIKLTAVPSSSSKDTDDFCELYSPNWVIFQPDIIIDAKIGCLWHIKLNLHPLEELITDKFMLIGFLLLRENSKDSILRVCKNALSSVDKLPIMTISKIFDKLNVVLKQHSSNEGMEGLGSIRSTNISTKRCIVIEQSDIFLVFSTFEENKNVSYKFIVAVMTEYLRSLSANQIQAQHYLYELLINIMVQHGCFYQLHQFLQYHIFNDSKPLACLLLSLRNVYPASNQLALDMLKRLGKANDEIIEVLLSQRQVLPALKFVRSAGLVDNISARKFLEAAQNCVDDEIYFATFKFFEMRNLRLRGNPNFLPGDHCELYSKHFEKMFNKVSSLSEQLLTKIDA